MRQLALILAGLFVVIALGCGSSKEAAAPEALSMEDQLVQKNTQARGGLSALRTVQSMRKSGSLNVQGMDIPMTVQNKRPSKYRMDASVEAMGMVFTTAFDGETGWEMNPMLGSRPRELSPERAAELKIQADIDGELVGYKEKGITLRYEGEAQVDGKPAHQLKVILPDSTEMTQYLDAETFQVVRIDGMGLDQQTGRRIPTETSFGDFRPVGDLVYPHELVTKSSAGSMKITVSQVELNVPIADSLFKFPG